MDNIVLKVREIFYSLQGEGGRAGEASIFIRFALCNKNCWFCDTDWSWGNDMSIKEILDEIKDYKTKWIVFTGGEPTLQLTDEIVKIFKDEGYMLAIETNGTNKVPVGIDYVTCSPKVSSKIVRENFASGVDEFRYPLGEGQIAPNIESLPYARNYYVSPLFLGEEKKRFELDKTNLEYCIEYCKENPEWKLSVQQHKIWDIR